MSNTKPKQIGSRDKCEHCGEPYTVKRAWQRYCTPKCRVAAYWESHEVIKKAAQ